jgi:hypothetical protein
MRVTISSKDSLCLRWRNKHAQLSAILALFTNGSSTLGRRSEQFTASAKQQMDKTNKKPTKQTVVVD